jgi:hypothetical protein
MENQIRKKLKAELERTRKTYACYGEKIPQSEEQASTYLQGKIVGLLYALDCIEGM